MKPYNIMKIAPKSTIEIKKLTPTSRTPSAKYERRRKTGQREMKEPQGNT